MRTEGERFVAAIALSDIHLTLKAPVSRGDEDWLVAQARPWNQINALAGKHKCPVLCAGDVFDTWNPPPELVNWACDTLPTMWAIPGQHDLRYHRYEDIKRTGYWTLVKCGVIKNVSPGKPEFPSDWIRLHGFPWGTPLKPWVMGAPIQGLDVALVHGYCWADGKGFPGAEQRHHLSKQFRQTKGYHVTVFGDNHKPFSCKAKNRILYNCGGLMRRKSDEKDYRPSVGLIWSDGDVTRVKLDTSKDVLLSAEKAVEQAEEFDFEAFLDLARSIGSTRHDFRSALEALMATKNSKPAVKELVMRFATGDKP